jgi:hypothetical protein
LAKISYPVQPSRLYRYRSLENESLERELEAITQGYLYCSPYLKLNDPMEGQFTSSTGLRSFDKYREIKRAVIDTKAAIGMCSFSEVYNHELMWAHYANQFKGICIAYNLPRLLKHLAESVEFVRMFYNEKEPTIHRSSSEPRILAKMVLSYKNYRWLYEREWRMFGDNPGQAIYAKTSCVTHVYLGSRIHDDDRLRIITALRPLKIKASTMSITK